MPAAKRAARAVLRVTDRARTAPQSTTLHLLVSRHPYEWLTSMRRNSFYANFHKGLPMPAFLTLEWMSVDLPAEGQARCSPLQFPTQCLLLGASGLRKRQYLLINCVHRLIVTCDIPGPNPSNCNDAKRSVSQRPCGKSVHHEFKSAKNCKAMHHLATVQPRSRENMSHHYLVTQCLHVAHIFSANGRTRTLSLTVRSLPAGWTNTSASRLLPSPTPRSPCYHSPGCTISRPLDLTGRQSSWETGTQTLASGSRRCWPCGLQSCGTGCGQSLGCVTLTVPRVATTCLTPGASDLQLSSEFPPSCPAARPACSSKHPSPDSRG